MINLFSYPLFKLDRLNGFVALGVVLFFALTHFLFLAYAHCTHCQAHKPSLKPKLAKKYNLAEAQAEKLGG